MISFPILTHAQQVGISLNPSLSEVNIQPGNNIKLVFYLENIGDPALLSLKVIPIEGSDYYGNVRLNTSKHTPLLFSFEGITDRSFIMKSKESKKVILQVAVPEKTPEKDYYYSIIAQTDPPPGQEGVPTARVRAAIGSNLLISVMKKYPAEVRSKIVLFDPKSTHTFSIFGKPLKIVNADNPLNLILNIENSGKHRVKPDGTVSIKNTFGFQKKISLLPQNILSEWQRFMKIEPVTIPSGFYTVTAEITYPTTTNKNKASFTFIALSFRVIIIAVVVIISAICGFFIWNKKRTSDFEDY